MARGTGQRRWLKYGAALALSSTVVLVSPWIQSVGHQRLFFLATAAVVLSTVYGGFGPGLLATLVSFLGTLWLMLPTSAAIPSWEDLLPSAIFLLVLLLITLLSSYRHLSSEKTRGREKDLEQQLAMVESTNRSLKQQVLDRERKVEERLKSGQKGSGVGEKAYRQIEERLRAVEHLLSAARLGLAVVNQEFRYQRMNEFFSSLVGVSLDAYEGRTIQEATAQVWLTLAPLLRRVAKTGEPLSWQETCSEVVAGQGTRSWLISCYPIKSGSGESFFLGIVMMDMTDRKRVQNLLVQQAQDLARSHARLERLAYTAFYDLKDPLAIITRTTKILAERYGEHPDDTTGQLIGQTMGQIAHMERLLGELVSYLHGGTETRAVGPIEMENILDWAVRNLDADLAESRAVVTHGPLPTIKGNATELIHLFQNIIGQAIKSPARTAPRIHVSARLRKRSEGNAPEWIFSVKDESMAIDPRTVDRIFLVYEGIISGDHQTENGLALATCKKIVEGFGGRIWVEFQPGVGSILYFSLPPWAN